MDLNIFFWFIMELDEKVQGVEESRTIRECVVWGLNVISLIDKLLLIYVLCVNIYSYGVLFQPHSM